MGARTEDWHKQSRRDLHHARQALKSGHFEWACFAAQQGAEKALKALYQGMGAEARGCSVFGLLENLPPSVSPDSALTELAKELDKHYIPTRYPNAYAEGAPYEYYTTREAERAIAQAEQILGFCEGHLS